MQILITGAAGWTAVSIIQALHQAGHTITGFDLENVQYPHHIIPLLSQMFFGDISDFSQVQTVVQSSGCDAILHLAVAIGADDYQQPDIPFAVNVKGAYNVFEAARQSGVNKIVVTSSAAVHLPYPDSTSSDWKSSADNDHVYDLTKRLQEEIARDFCQTFGIRSVVLRVGHIVDGEKQVDPKGRILATLKYCRGGWVCRYDLAQACLGAIALPSAGYSMFYVIGAVQSRQHFDIARTERELGLAFKTKFEQYS